MVKLKTIGIILLLLIIPIVSVAEYAVQVLIQGTVGDFSKTSRDYEIDGNIYHFPQDIILENSAGKQITFDHIRGGSAVKVIGEKIIGPTVAADKVVYNKIILLKK